MKISVDVDIEGTNFILGDDISTFTTNKRTLMYLKEYLHVKIGGDFIQVPYDPDHPEVVLQKVINVIKRSNAEFVPTHKIQEMLEDFFREENNFSSFSQQARAIRNNELENQTDQFKDFTNSLISLLPSRRLYPLQLLSSYHLAFSQNSCNFSVPGSGKTSIVYGAYSYLKSLADENPKKVDRLMIIGPLSSFGPWEDEYLECFGTPPTVKRISGTTNRRERKLYFHYSNPAELTLVSYYSVPKIYELIVLFLRKHKTMVVLDEAHKIKNVEGGVIAETTLKLAKYCRSRVVLTGTPAPNGYEDIDNLFQFIWPTKKIIPFNTFQLKEMSTNLKDARVNQLINSISPYFIRIRKSDLGIPDPIENEPIILKMGSVQREIYDFIEKKYMEYFINQSGNSINLDILTKARMIRLMQVSSNPALLRKPLDDYFLEQGISNALFIDDSNITRKIIEYYKVEVPPKFIRAGELVKEIINKGMKVVVWAIFIQNILDFSNYLNKIGIQNKTLYGATPIESNENDPQAETREKIIREFHNPNSEFQVILANPFAVSESISLHKVCHDAIYLERSFNAAQFIQSKDRIHRYGLKPDDRTNYYYILSDNNTDRTIHERLVFKEKRMLDIIENEPIPLFKRIEEDETGDFRSLIDNYVKQRTTR